MSAATPALCGNPDCGAFFDRSPVPHWDRDGRVVVLLCHECTEFFEGESQPRYDQLEPPDVTT